MASCFNTESQGLIFCSRTLATHGFRKRLFSVKPAHDFRQIFTSSTTALRGTAGRSIRFVGCAMPGEWKLPKLPIGRHGKLVAGHLHQQLMPFADLDRAVHRLLPALDRLLLLVGQLLFRRPRGVDVEPHVAGFQILQKDLLRADAGGERIAR